MLLPPWPSLCVANGWNSLEDAFKHYAGTPFLHDVDFPVSIYDFERNLADLTEAKAPYDGLLPSVDSILAAKDYNDQRDGA